MYIKFESNDSTLIMISKLFLNKRIKFCETFIRPLLLALARLRRVGAIYVLLVCFDLLWRACVVDRETVPCIFPLC